MCSSYFEDISSWSAAAKFLCMTENARWQLVCVVPLMLLDSKRNAKGFGWLGELERV